MRGKSRHAENVHCNAVKQLRDKARKTENSERDKANRQF